MRTCAAATLLSAMLTNSKAIARSSHGVEFLMGSSPVKFRSGFSLRLARLKPPAGNCGSAAAAAVRLVVPIPDADPGPPLQGVP